VAGGAVAMANWFFLVSGGLGLLVVRTRKRRSWSNASATSIAITWSAPGASCRACPG